MKTTIGVILGLMLVSSIFVTNIHAEGGNQVWLIKTKRGIDISCPYGFQYDENGSVYSCTKVRDSIFDVRLSYNTLYVEEEFFNEKDILKDSISALKLFSEVDIINKKTSSWFGKITIDIEFVITDKEYQSYGLKGFQRTIAFDDGTVIMMRYIAKQYGHDTADKMLSSNIRILEPSQVIGIEKAQQEYDLKSQEIASKRDAEAFKKKLEQEQKAKEAKKKAQDEADAKRKAAEIKKAQQKAEKQKINAQKKAERIEKNLIVFGDQIQDIEKRFDVIEKNPSSSKILIAKRSLEVDLAKLESKYDEFKTKKTDALEAQVRNLYFTLQTKMNALENKKAEPQPGTTSSPQNKIMQEIASYEYDMSYLKNMLMNLDMTAQPEEKSQVRNLVGEFTYLQEQLAKVKENPSKQALNTFKSQFTSFKTKLGVK